MSLALLAVQIAVVVVDPQPQWFNYLIIVALAPVFLLVAYRVLVRYKKVSMGDRKIEVHYPLLRISRKYQLDDLEYWTEAMVKTGKKTTYRELELKFTDRRKLQMGYREYTSYEQMIKYLGQKAAGKKKT